MNLKSTKYANLVQDTKVNLDSTTKVFPAGIVIHESDSGKIKVSDGINLYRDLPYVGSDVPTDHSSTEPTFGIGTAEKYGHVKVALPEGGVKISEVKEIKLSSIHSVSEEDNQPSEILLTSVAKSSITGNTVTVLSKSEYNADIDEVQELNDIIMKNSDGEEIYRSSLTGPSVYGLEFEVKYLNNNFVFYCVDYYHSDYIDDDSYTTLPNRLYISDGSANEINLQVVELPWLELIKSPDGSLSAAFSLKDITYDPNNNEYLLLGYSNDSWSHGNTVYVVHINADTKTVSEVEHILADDTGNLACTHCFKVLSDGTIAIVVVPYYSSGE